MLSVRVHFTYDTLIAAGAQQKEVSTGGRRLHFRNYVFTVTPEKEVYLSLDPQAFIPRDLSQFVAYVSLHETFPGPENARRMGQYRHKSAVFDLERSRERDYVLKGRASTVEDAYELCSLVRGGRIWPTVDYEVEQGVPFKERFRQFRRQVYESFK